MIKLNDEQINVTLFPDNTSQVWNIDLDILSKSVTDKRFRIDWNFTHEGELSHIVQLVLLLKTIKPEYKINLHMDYLPYGRQDKNITNNSTFALCAFALVINSLQLDEVSSIDTHNSEATDFIINNFKNIFPYTHIAAAVNKSNPDILAFPDKGAIRRYGKELAFLGKIHTYGEKERDQQTGHITNYSLQDVSLLKDRTVLMVDDICDGGMTFIHLSKALLTAGAKSVNLYTTHGIYSKGLRPLREAKIERIFNKNGEVGEIQGNIAIKEY